MVLGPLLAAIAFQASAASAASLPRSRLPADLVPGDRVVCLFDSTEGTTRDNNPLSAAVAPAIGRMGFRVDWHDVASGLPARDGLSGARAVVSGFQDGAMSGAGRYGAFIDDMVRMGIRFVVVGNFGAWQERGSDVWIEPEALNRAFGALGVRYDADWTDDPAKFATVVHDPILRPSGRVGSKTVRHFYQFTPIRGDVRVLVGATRTDRELPESAVVFASGTGGMVLNRYLSPDDRLADPRSFQLDLDRLLEALLARSPRDPATLLVVHDPAASDSRRALEALAVASDYTGIPMNAVSVRDIRDLRPADLASHAGIVLAAADVKAPHDDFLAGLVRDLLSRGGRALAVLPVRNGSLAAVLGHRGAEPPAAASGAGIRFAKGAYPGLDGFEILAERKDDLGFTGTRPDLGPGCRVLAETPAGPSGPGFPLWWRCALDTGEAAALNAFELSDRGTTGLVVQAVLDVAGSWAMPVLAARVEFVDDCPLPMTGATSPAFGKPDTRFYLDDFYPMMVEANRRFGMRPTFLVVFGYDEAVVPPFPGPLDGPGRAASLALGNRILADDFPVGLHGTNHVSPALSGGVTKSFPDEAALRSSFRAASRAFASVFGPAQRPLVYVPPNDYIDRAGKVALKAEVPSLRVIASLFSGTEVETAQDFGPDPDVPGVLDFPRTWAGYRLSGEAALGMVNGVLLAGVSSHFIHPDDVFDPERSGGLNWTDLRRAFLDGAESVRARFPFLREMTVMEAARELDRLLDAGLAVKVVSEGGLRIERSAGTTGSTMLLVRMPKGPIRVSGGSLVASDPESGRYLVRMEARVLDARPEAR
jgi:hypothetical protein